MTARDLTADEAFRAEVRQFLQDELTPELRAEGRRNAGIFSDYDAGNGWHRVLAKRGWSVPHWPVEWGGTGWTPMQHYIFASECILAGAPARAPQGPSMVAPVLFKYGTQAQKDQWLPAIRTGDDYWAQGYSEPGSGSDLASLQCRAVREGDHYVINGTKIWTTHAHFANRIFCLVRTSTTGKPQQGISFLLFDMDQPGITVRPIISISGDHELNQVFFDDVRVPASALLGQENQGWTIAKYLLVHERGGAYTPAMRARLARLQAMAAAGPPAPLQSTAPGALAAPPVVNAQPAEPLLINGFTTTTLGWLPWLPTVDVATATPEQLAALDAMNASARQSPYFLLLAHQP